MATELATRPASGALTQDTIADVIERVIAAGDLSKLSSQDRTAYYLRTCESLGLNPLTHPFEYITLNQKLTLYARKDATDQLRRLQRVSIEVVNREQIGDIYVVTARATMPDGRQDEEIGAVTTKGLAGDALANALMKATTKAKRRVTLSVCGLGFLDETEVETVPGAVVGEHSAPAGHTRGSWPRSEQGQAERPQMAQMEFANSPEARTLVVEPAADADYVPPLYRKWLALVEEATERGLRAGADFPVLTLDAPDELLVQEGKKLRRLLLSRAEAAEAAARG